jgi:hypothetical protein
MKPKGVTEIHSTPSRRSRFSVRREVALPYPSAPLFRHVLA